MDSRWQPPGVHAERSAGARDHARSGAEARGWHDGGRTIDLAAVWNAATDELADEISPPQQRAYLRLTRLRAIVEDTALLSVPDAFTRDVIESRLRPAITEALSRRLGRPIQVAVTVRPPRTPPARPAPSAAATGPARTARPRTTIPAAAGYAEQPPYRPSRSSSRRS